MAKRRALSVIVASDGSRDGRAAVAATVRFPWPAGTRVRGVVARDRAAIAADVPASVWTALEQGAERVGARMRRALRRRWPAAEVVIVNRPPVVAILGEVPRVRARTIVVGSRGHGPVGRLLMGSVSRSIVRAAPCPVLVVKGATRSVTRFLVGIDGSVSARRAVDYLGGLKPPRGGRVTIVRVVEPVQLPSMALLPGGVRAQLGRELARLNARRLAPARRDVAQAAAQLTRAGWKVRGVARFGAPLAELLAAARSARAQCLVLGARGVGGAERFLLGSVAQGVLGRAAMPVLVVR